MVSNEGTAGNPVTLWVPSWAVAEIKGWSYFFFLALFLFTFFCWNLGAPANGYYYVLQMIYGGRNEANCPLRVTIARITESKYYLPQVPVIPHFVAAAMWINPCRLPYQADFLLQGLQRLCIRATGRQVLGCLVMLLAVATLHVAKVNGNGEFSWSMDGYYAVCMWTELSTFLALPQNPHVNLMKSRTSVSLLKKKRKKMQNSSPCTGVTSPMLLKYVQSIRFSSALLRLYCALFSELLVIRGFVCSALFFGCRSRNFTWNRILRKVSCHI